MMHGGANGFHYSDEAIVSISANEGSDAQRRRYSKDELLHLRTLSKRSPAFVESLRVSLGPVASGVAGCRGISKVGYEGRAIGRDARSAPTSLASSPPTRLDDRILQREQRERSPAEDSASNALRNESDNSSGRGTTVRDLARVFQTSPDSFFSAIASRSPPTRRNEFGGSLGAKSDGDGSIASMSPEQKPRYDIASSPRDGTFYGFSEYRRRSPSPRPSPKGSPRRSPSPTCPPGFGPPLHAKVPVSQVSRNLVNSKVKICRGPNLQENFATRIAYRERQLALQGSKNVDSEAHDNSSNSNEKRELINVFLKASERVGDASKSTTELGNSNGAGPSFEMKRPPPINYSISSDVSFDDFSKRLAAEIGNTAILENKQTQFESDIIASLEAGDESTDFTERPTYAERIESHVVQNGKAASAADQDAMDELSKWFRRIAASSQAEGDQEDAPEPNIEESAAEAPFTTQKKSSEELDSGVLSFFDTIKSQALSEGNCLVLENSSPIDAGEDNSSEDPMGISSTLQHDTTHTEGVDNYDDTTEVEQFFQLFTEGKPVYGTEHQQTATGRGVNAKLSEAHVEHVADTKVSLTSRNEPDSDTQGLERWFAALASGGQI